MDTDTKTKREEENGGDKGNDDGDYRKNEQQPFMRRLTYLCLFIQLNINRGLLVLLIIGVCDL